MNTRIIRAKWRNHSQHQSINKAIKFLSIVVAILITIYLLNLILPACNVADYCY